MSTRQVMAPRCTSKFVNVSKAVIKAICVPNRREKKQNVASTMAIAANADGRREVNSLTPPASVDIPATSQWSKGGLNAISSPLFTGKIQLPSLIIDIATTASRGSPRVLNGVASRKSSNDIAQIINNGIPTFL